MNVLKYHTGDMEVNDYYEKIGVLGLMAALAVTGAVAFLPKGVMAAEDSDQTISQGVYIGDVDVSGMTQEEAKKQWKMI